MKNLSLLLFDDVEVLDFAGPFEVFSVANELNQEKLFSISTVSLSTSTTVRAKNGLTVIANKLFEDLDAETLASLDVLLVPGGEGVRALLKNDRLLQTIATMKADKKIVASICTGALILAKAGVLKHEIGTTHHLCIDELERLEPTLTVDKEKRFYDRGHIITSGGISAGIDMSLYLLGRLCGKDIQQQTLKYMEYDYQENL